MVTPMPNTQVSIGNLTLRNPIMTASGTFGYGSEYAPFLDLASLGGIIVKGTTLEAREGNPYPRMCETPAGMLNAVGLQNKGADYFAREIYPTLKDLDTRVVVNVSGSSVEDYCRCAQIMDSLENIPAIELNISCPNVKHGGMVFGVDPKAAASVVEAVRKVYRKTLIVKLSPNVTDITEIARAVEGAGADALSLINTLLGMAVNYKTRRPMLSTVTGGLSGPCVKPIALRMVWQVSRAVSLPIIGLGGITSTTDVVEFLLAGATAVQIGTYNFVDPSAAQKIARGLDTYLQENGIADVHELIGGLITE